MLTHYFVILDNNYPLALTIAAGVGLTFGWLVTIFAPLDKWRRGRVGTLMEDLFSYLLRMTVIMSGLVFMGDADFSMPSG